MPSPSVVATTVTCFIAVSLCLCPLPVGATTGGGVEIQPQRTQLWHLWHAHRATLSHPNRKPFNNHYTVYRSEGPCASSQHGRQGGESDLGLGERLSLLLFYGQQTVTMTFAPSASACIVVKPQTAVVTQEFVFLWRYPLRLALGVLVWIAAPMFAELSDATEAAMLALAAGVVSCSSHNLYFNLAVLGLLVAARQWSVFDSYLPLPYYRGWSTRGGRRGGTTETDLDETEPAAPSGLSCSQRISAAEYNWQASVYTQAQVRELKRAHPHIRSRTPRLFGPNASLLAAAVAVAVALALLLRCT